MSTQRVIRQAALLGAALVILSSAIFSHAEADTVVALGSGVNFQSFSGRESLAPTLWLSLRGQITDSWSVFTRFGYEHHSAPVPVFACFGLNCPGVRGEQRVTYVPASLGFRLSSAPRPTMRARAFLEIASSLAWTRFEDDVKFFFPDGRRQQTLNSSDHLLAGVELGAGFHYTLTGSLGAEWGLRYAYRGAPSRTDANRDSGIGRDGISSLSLVVGFTLAR